MFKRIDLDDGNKWSLSIEKGYCTNTVSFSKGYLKNGELIKSIDFCIWDDIAFHAYLNADEYPDTLDFDFTINDPVYFYLLKLLGNDNELIIDDDDSYERMKKFMTIKRLDTSIKIIFNNFKNDNIRHNKYGAFIKNIGHDGRSKIEDITIKYRIVDFFRATTRRLLEEYPQMTIDEYLETLRVKEIEEKGISRKLEK